MDREQIEYLYAVTFTRDSKSFYWKFGGSKCYLGRVSYPNTYAAPVLRADARSVLGIL